MGPEGYQAFFTQLRSAFPDMQVEVKKLVADGDSVAFAYTLTGTHQGDFNGHKPTGKAIKVRGMQIGRFVDGKMVERWGASDELGILKQIGAIEG
jgi:predicted ester cyclase